jgi:hypothetical protein
VTVLMPSWNVRHDRLLEKVAQRVDDEDIMHLLKIMLKASGKKAAISDAARHFHAAVFTCGARNM